MKRIDELLRTLERRDVSELALVSNRLPSVRVGASFDPVDDEALSSDTILAMLVSAGGSRHVDDIGATPKQWAVRVPGVGNVGVTVVKRGEQVVARFSVMGRPPEPAAPKKSVRPTPRASVRPEQRPSKPAVRKASIRAQKPTRPDTPRASMRPRPLDEPRKKSIPPASVRPTPKSDRASARAMAASKPDGEFRRAPTAPALPKRGLGGARELTLDTPVPPEEPKPEPKKPHIHVKSKSGQWKPEADTQPAILIPSIPAELVVLLGQARNASATDVHLVAGRPPLLRIGGDLRAIGSPIDPEEVAKMVMSIVPRRLTETLETAGSCDFGLDLPKESLGRFRVNVGRQQTGLKATFRLIPKELPTLKALGLPPELTRATAHHQGLVVFTGPTGHGKTTTLTAVVDHINESFSHHVITVEDPVENVHPKKKSLMSQREVGTHTKTFASALRAALREDPDVIVVGELRDVETVRMAVAASETGHLVLGTMNTPSASKTIDRLIDLFPPADQPQVRLTLAGGLRLIVGQRLVPTPDRSKVHAAIELLPGSVPLAAMIRDNKTFQIPSLQQRGKGIGIIRLDESLADLVRSGRAAYEDALGYAEGPNEFEALVKTKPAPAAGAPQPSPYGR